MEALVFKNKAEEFVIRICNDQNPLEILYNSRDVIIQLNLNMNVVKDLVFSLFLNKPFEYKIKIDKGFGFEHEKFLIIKPNTSNGNGIRNETVQLIIGLLVKLNGEAIYKYEKTYNIPAEYILNLLKVLEKLWS